MDAAEQLAPTITEPFTWAEICDRYPDQHVCLAEIDRACEQHPPGVRGIDLEQLASRAMDEHAAQPSHLRLHAGPTREPRPGQVGGRLA